MESSTFYKEFTFGPDQVLPAESFKTSKPDGAIRIYNKELGEEKPISAYTFFKQCAEKFQDHEALIIERNGQWMKWSYSEYFEEACIIAKAMIKLGLEQFHGVCIMGYNAPEWMFSNFGAIFAGGFSAGVYTTNSPETCLYIAKNCRAQIIVVEDKICLDKFLAVKNSLPHVKAFIQWSGEPGAPGVLSWAEFLAIGKQEPDEILKKRLSLAAVNQCSTLIYTSGTTGPPKGVMCSQDQMTWAAMTYVSYVDFEYGGEIVLSYLPLSHIAANLSEMYISLYIGATLYFAPADALKGTLGLSLQKVRPTGLYGVPRVWEKIYEKMREAAANSGFIMKSLGSWAKYHSLNYHKALMENRELSASESLKHSAAKSLILTRVKKALGLDRSRHLYSGSAPIAPEVLEYFYSLDMPIKEIYGLSESLSMCTMNIIQPDQFKIGSVGKIMGWNEVKLMHTDEHRKGEGEICIRGRNICMGYLEMPENTDEAIDEDGWLHSGDLGWIDPEGFLYITGRLKELVITAGGENIPPVLIEDIVKRELPCVSNAMLVGDKRRYLSILLTLKAEMNLDTGEPLQELTLYCQQWMRDNGLNAADISEVINEVENKPNSSVARAIQQGIDRYNTMHAMSNAQRIQKWSILPHDFSLPTGELNNTFKLKRSFVLEKYATTIDKMYTSSNVPITSKL